MSNVCICIEGEIKSENTSALSIKKHLINKLNADIFLCVQNYIGFQYDNIVDYTSTYIKYILYNNPIPNFSTTFDELCNFYNINPCIWRKTFETIHGDYKLGFDKPGLCIRRMFNRYILLNELKKLDYEWFIITRSDLHFINDFNDISQLKYDCLNIFSNDSDMYNNDFIAFHKSNLEKILNYIIHFLNGSVLEKYKSNYNNQKIDEQTFFKINMEISNVNIHFIKNTWTISSENNI